MEKVILTSMPSVEIVGGIRRMFDDIKSTRIEDFDVTKARSIIQKKCNIANEVLNSLWVVIENLNYNDEKEYVPDIKAIYLEKLKEAGLRMKQH